MDQLGNFGQIKKDEANMNNLEILAQTETHLRNSYNWKDNRRDRKDNRRDKSGKIIEEIRSKQMATSRRWRRWWNGRTIKYQW